jgi:hypothetical protein
MNCILNAIPRFVNNAVRCGWETEQISRDFLHSSMASSRSAEFPCCLNRHWTAADRS